MSSIQSLTKPDLEQLQRSFAAWARLDLMTDAFRVQCGETAQLIETFLTDPSEATAGPMVDAILITQIAAGEESTRINQLDQAANAMRIAQALNDPRQWARDLGAFLGNLSEPHARMAMEQFADEFSTIGEVFRALRMQSPAGMQ